MELTQVNSQFVVADAYRVGQIDGFKAGVAAGVVVMVLIKSLRERRQNRGWWWKENWKPSK